MRALLLLARAGLLGLWVGVQPWLPWPGLFADVSHRLTLVSVAVAMGLLTLTTAGVHRPLPAWWSGLVLLSVGVIVRHQWAVIQTADYFAFFQETALFCDGLLVLLAVTWGVWGLLQLPVAWFRRVRWLGVLLLSLSAVGVLSHHTGWWTGLSVWPMAHAAGLFQLDRLLGAYALLWLPICWVQSPWLAMLPFAVILASGKPLILAGAGLSLWLLLRPRARWGGLLASVLGVGLVLPGNWLDRVALRWDTWTALWQASLQHPLIGHGFHPLTMAQVSQAQQTPLPSTHSDWLALALHAGWLVTALAAWQVWWVWRTPTPTAWGRALRASLLSLAAVCAVQQTLAHASLAGTALVLLVWWSHETSEVWHGKTHETE